MMLWAQLHFAIYHIEHDKDSKPTLQPYANPDSLGTSLVSLGRIAAEPFYHEKYKNHHFLHNSQSKAFQPKNMKSDAKS